MQDKRNRLREVIRRDGWLIAVLAAGIFVCLLTAAGTPSSSVPDADDHFADILSAMEGAGRVDVAVSYTDEDRSVPCGAVVIADGADDILVQLRLRRALSALTGLPNAKIEIFKREEAP